MKTSYSITEEKMYVTQIVYKGWYTDAIVSALEDLPIKYLFFIKEIGITSEVSMRGIIITLRRPKPSNIRRGIRLLPTRERGESSSERARRILIRQSSRNVWTPIINNNRQRGNVLHGLREHGMGDNMEPWKGRRERSSRNSTDRIIKLDIDVDISYYNIEKVAEDKLKMLSALGYRVIDVKERISPSGRHLHMFIELDHEIPLQELFYLQFILGDDPKRAQFNFFRLEHFPEYAKNFNVLFEKKEKITWKKKIMVIIRAILKKITR